MYKICTCIFLIKSVYMDRSFVQEQITATKAQIIAYQNAVTALAAGNIQSYKIDTGQTVSWVTKFDIKDLNSIIDSLYNRCSTLQLRLGGGGTVIMRPGF